MKAGTISDSGLPRFRTELLLVIVVLLMWAGQVTAANMEATSVQSVEIKSPTSTGDVTPSVDVKALADIIGPIMEDKLAPVLQKQAILEKLLLEEKFSGPKMTDVIGGIGWILGLAGIVAYFMSLRQEPGKK